MYTFVDTIEQANGVNLPAEAVSINGQFIENVIAGYRTLYTSGRESLEKELEMYEDTAQNGSVVKYTRFPARTIVVGFQLIAVSEKDFRDKFNTLNSILNVENAEIVFYDEQDKFFIGNPIMNAEIEPGRFVVTGEYEIYCSDPFKYSVEWQEPQAVFDEGGGSTQTFLIDYGGTVPSFPKYIAEFYNPDGETDEDNAEDNQTDMTQALGTIGSCNYVAFFDDENHILQFGNPDLDENAEIPAPLVLTNRSFRKNGSYDSSETSEEWESPAKGASVLSKSKQQGSLKTKAAIYGSSQLTITKDQILLAGTNGTDCKYQSTVTQVDSRTSSTVKLHVQVKLSGLKTAISKGATLTIVVSCGEKEISKILKKSNVSWSKGTSHSCAFTMTVSASSSKKELSGIKIKVTRSNGTYKSNGKTKKATGSAGTLTSKVCKIIEIPYYIAIDANSYYVTPSSYGDAVKGYQTGPTMTWTYPSAGLPNTDDGVGANCFDLTWNMKFCMGKTTNETLQMGAFECLLITGDSMDSNGVISNQKTLAGFVATKTINGSKGNVYLYVMNKQKYKLKNSTDMTWKNGAFGNKNGLTACKISSDGNRIEFKIGKMFNKGTALTFKLTKDWKEKRVFKVVFGFYRYSANPAFDWNGINAVKFKKIYKTETELQDIPFSAGQTLIANTQNFDVLLDDVSTPSLGALGNDWENMCLKPGINQISTSFGQRETDAVKVMRRCRTDEPFQGAVTDEDGESIATAAADTLTYFCAETETTKNIFKVETKTATQVVTSEVTFSSIKVTEDEYNSNPTEYFVLEEPKPKFRINYREVFM